MLSCFRGSLRLASVLAASLALLGTAARAQIIVVTPGTNITGDNTPIEGINTGDYSQLGTLYNQFGEYPPNSLIDGNLGSYNTTYSGGFQGNSSFAGIEGSSLQTSSNTGAVTYVQATFRLFVDGGWFGPTNVDPGADTPLLPSDLTTPEVQITTNGTDWTTVDAQSDYIFQLTGALHDNGLNSNVVTFALDTPETNIEGIRLIGNSGGIAGGDQGFLGFTELTVYSGGDLVVPEPSTWALLALGAAGLAGWMFRRRALTA
jgi:hypothetical protein